MVVTVDVNSLTSTNLGQISTEGIVLHYGSILGHINTQHLSLLIVILVKCASLTLCVSKYFRVAVLSDLAFLCKVLRNCSPLAERNYVRCQLNLSGTNSVHVVPDKISTS